MWLLQQYLLSLANETNANCQAAIDLADIMAWQRLQYNKG